MKRLLFPLLLLVGLSLCANTLDQIRASKTIRVGVYPNNPPFSKLNGSTFEGFEIDMVKRIADDIFGGAGAGKVEFVPLTTKDRIPFLQENKIDLAVAIFTVTAERAKQVDFAPAYFSTHLGVLTRKEDKILSLDEFKKGAKKMIVQKSSTGEAMCIKQNIDVVHCGDYKECFGMLLDGTGDGWLNDSIVVLSYNKQQDTDGVTEVPENLKRLGVAEFLAIGVDKGNDALYNFVSNEMLKLSKDGFFKKAFDDKINPYYKGEADKRYFLLDDLYNAMF